MNNKEKPCTYTGPFKDVIPKFIEYKQSLGFKYNGNVCHVLLNMDRYFNNKGISKVMLTREMVEEYTKVRDNEATATTISRPIWIREFAKYLHLLNYDNIYVLPNNYYLKNKCSFIPYIYTENDMSRIFEAFDSFPLSIRTKRRHIVFATAIRVLYGCGTRIRETLSLKVSDVSFTDSIIQIIGGKGNVSRIIVLSDSLTAYLKHYIAKMNLSNEDYLFPSPYGGEYNDRVFFYIFKQILAQLNIKNSRGQIPRLHDLRHTFAVHALNRMIEQNIDPYSALPVLSSYLGHYSVKATERYLRLTEEYYQDILDLTDNIYHDVFPEVMLDA